MLDTLRASAIRDVIFAMMKKFVDEFSNEIFAFLSRSFMMQSECVLLFLPTLATFFLSRKVSGVFSEQTFCLAIPARVLFLFAFGSRQIVRCANVNSDRIGRTHFRCIGDFTGDMSIPAACFFDECHFFRIALKRAVHAYLDITQIWDFQTVMAKVGFFYRVLTDAFTCFEFVLSQTPRQRTDTHFEARVTFFLCTFFTSSTERIKGFVNPFENRYLKILWHFSEVVIFLTGNLQKCLLVISRNKTTFFFVCAFAIIARSVLKFAKMVKPS